MTTFAELARNSVPPSGLIVISAMAVNGGATATPDIHQLAEPGSGSWATTAPVARLVNIGPMFGNVQNEKNAERSVARMSSVPDPSRDPYQAAITRAADLVGGLEALSHRLQVPMADIIRWLDGINRPPMGIFLKLVDVLNEETHRPRVAQQKR